MHSNKCSEKTDANFDRNFFESMNYQFLNRSFYPHSVCLSRKKPEKRKKPENQEKTGNPEKSRKRREKGSQNIKACRIENTLKLVTSP
jgi:hypothetical protein